MEKAIHLPLFKHTLFRLIHNVTLSEMHFYTETRDVQKIIH